MDNNPQVVGQKPEDTDNIIQVGAEKNENADSSQIIAEADGIRDDNLKVVDSEISNTQGTRIEVQPKVTKDDPQVTDEEVSYSPQDAAGGKPLMEDNPQTSGEEIKHMDDGQQAAAPKPEDIKENTKAAGRKRRKKLSKEELRENFKIYRSIDYSGFIERLFARGVDFLIAASFGYFMYKRVDLTWSILYSIGFDLILRIATTYFLGCTIGKFIFGVRVISRCSAKPSIWQVIIREFAKYISGCFLNLGYVSIIVSRRKRAWHDIVACTAVTSGGRDEAEYGRDIYNERPERWNVYIAGILTLFFTIAVLMSINKGADYLINERGLVGFLKVIDTKGAEFKYKVPPESMGLAGINKNIIQVGDVDADKGFEMFRESIRDGKTAIKDFRITPAKPIEGERGVICEKPVIQYRLLDINGDKKDELVILFEDKTIKAYKVDREAVEIGSLSPVQYSQITAVFKGKPSEYEPYKFYIMGDKNSLTVVSMSGGRLESREFDLPGTYNIVSLDMGIFSGKDYIVGATDDHRLVFYSEEGGIYKMEKEMAIPVEGKITAAVKDLNCDGKNEVLISSLTQEGGEGQVLAGYDVSGDVMKLMWDGGRYYRYMDGKISMVMDYGGDIDNDGKFEAYMVNREVSGQEGRAKLIVFESDKYLFKVNDILRTLVLSNPR